MIIAVAGHLARGHNEQLRLGNLVSNRYWDWAREDDNASACSSAIRPRDGSRGAIRPGLLN